MLNGGLDFGSIITHSASSCNSRSGEDTSIVSAAMTFDLWTLSTFRSTLSYISYKVLGSVFKVAVT
jgi:hypothetical protein